MPRVDDFMVVGGRNCLLRLGSRLEELAARVFISSQNLFDLPVLAQDFRRRTEQTLRGAIVYDLHAFAVEGDEFGASLLVKQQLSLVLEIHLNEVI